MSTQSSRVIGDTQSRSALEDAKRELEDALRMLDLEMVAEDDPRAADGKTHASPAFMTGYVAGNVQAALKKLNEVRS